ncbi:MAG TPA: hypothetical protein V6C78_14385 [Crinalium sp.]|jgi:hypothetical protein
MSNELRLYPTTEQSATRQSSLWSRLEKPLTGLTFTIALILLNGGFPSLKAQGVEVPLSVSQHPTEVATAALAQQSPVLSNGTYLYGQAPEAEQLGSTYVVFEVDRNQHVVGAFYMPQSSFDCFQGELQANQLAVTVTDSYDRTTHPYAVAVESSATVAGRDGAAAPVSLAGFHSIQTVGANDERILSTCKAAYR